MTNTLRALSFGAALVASVFALDAQAQKGKLIKPSKSGKMAPAKSAKPAALAKPDNGVNIFKSLKPGIYFKKDVPGSPATLGSIIQGHLTVYDSSGKVVQSSRGQGKPVMFKLQPTQFTGDLNDLLTKMSSGDSAQLVISSDDMMKGVPDEQRPPMFPKGSNVVFGVQLEGVMSGEAYDAEQTKKLTDYATAKGLKPVTLPSGLMYVITTEGTGDKIRVNDKADVHYTGKLLNDQEFDSSIPRNQPFTVTVGTGGVIKGWDEGLQQFNKGAKGKLFIPYQLAYGEQGSPPKIMPFDPLVFDIEVLNIVRAEDAAAPATPPTSPAVPKK